MNKIVIVGHPKSGYEEVETLLNACGMATAQPSRREGYMPGQISTTLCKVHSTSPLSQLENDDQIQQIEAGPMWHGMALDLMLGNLEQPFWGWADPQSIYLLNYWRDLDPSITFILVYDRPHSVLTQASTEEAASLSPETLSQRTRNWAAYNATLLHFFHRNPHRCMLVHSQQVRESASSYLQQVRSRIDAPWSERMEQLSAPETSVATETPAEQTGNSHGNGAWYEAPTHANTQPKTNQPTPPSTADTVSSAAADVPSPPAPHHDPLALFVADALLRQHPTSLQLYEELQAVANLPFAEGADRIVTDDTALHAWLAMSAHQQRLQQQTRLAETQMGEINELNQRLSHTEALAQQKQQLVERLSQAQAQAEQLAQERQRVIDEQTRLHHSQTVASQQRLAGLQSQQQALQHAQQTAQQENELLLAQLHQVQEELERHYLANQEQAQKVQALLHTDKLAAERQQHIEQLRQQLATQTQQATEKTTQLSQQAELLKKQLAEKERQAQAHAAQLQAQLLAVQAQAAPVVDPALEQENELLLAQLHQVQEELERHYLENQRIKNTPITPPPLYGAAERVKQQLSYLLGSKMIERSRSLGGWLGMPFALIGVARQHRRELPQRKATEQIPIEQYRDAYEAERTKQHLSYGLGAALIKHSKNPLRWPVLPFALRREVKNHRNRKGV